MSDPTKKVKKIKIEKVIDYSRMPLEQWCKVLLEFQKTMDDLAIAVPVFERRVQRLIKACTIPEDML